VTAATEAEVIAFRAPTPNLNKALSQLQGELPRIAKTKTAKIEGTTKDGKPYSYPYSYADLGDVVADIGPLLAKYGLAFHCGPTINPADRREMILIWELLHESGEKKTGEWPLGPVNQKPQSLGSGITYGRRYCFTAATNIVLEDDDDGQRAQQDHSRRESAGDAFENATRERPKPNRETKGGQAREQASKPSAETAPSPAAQAAADETAIDEGAQAFADEAGRATSPHEIEDIHRRAREAQKVTLPIRNPSSGGIGKLAVYLDWRKKQLEKAARPAPATTFDQALAALGDSPWADSIRDIPDGDEEQARRLFLDASSVDLDPAKRKLVCDAILARFPAAAGEGQAAA
jgi:hypothetical protein